MLKDACKIFKALSDPSRVRIIFILQHRQLCVCELTQVLGLAFSTVSAHLKVLKEVKIVEERKEGKYVNYSLVEDNSPEMKALRNWIIGIRDPLLAQDLAQSMTVDRDDIIEKNKI